MKTKKSKTKLAVCDRACIFSTRIPTCSPSLVLRNWLLLYFSVKTKSSVRYHFLNICIIFAARCTYLHAHADTTSTNQALHPNRSHWKWLTYIYIYIYIFLLINRPIWEIYIHLNNNLRKQKKNCATSSLCRVSVHFCAAPNTAESGILLFRLILEKRKYLFLLWMYTYKSKPFTIPIIFMT